MQDKNDNLIFIKKEIEMPAGNFEYTDIFYEMYDELEDDKIELYVAWFRETAIAIILIFFDKSNKCYLSLNKCYKHNVLFKNLIKDSFSKKYKKINWVDYSLQ
jgi:hypothetical protein